MIKILGMRQPVGSFTGQVINTCATNGWASDLSPFLLGPCALYGDLSSQNMENAWQYSKVYTMHATADLVPKPTEAYWVWAKAGWANPIAVRFPMGRGARPLFSWWADQRLDYVAARKKIYAPLYARAVQKTAGFQQLRELAQRGDVALRDFDGYDHEARGLTLSQVLNLPDRKMGHSFVLKMLLTNDPALQEIDGGGQ